MNGGFWPDLLWVSQERLFCESSCGDGKESLFHLHDGDREISNVSACCLLVVALLSLVFVPHFLALFKHSDELLDKYFVTLATTINCHIQDLAMPLSK